MLVELGNKSFKTKAEALKFISLFMKTYKMGQSKRLINDGNLEWVKCLHSFHHRFNDISKVYFYCLNSKNEFVVRCNLNGKDKYDNFSYRKALDGYNNNNIDYRLQKYSIRRVKQAFHNETIEEKNKFKIMCEINNIDYACKICGCNKHIEADHIYPLQKIRDMWLRVNKHLKMEDIETVEIRGIISFKDRELANKWVKYHNKVLKYKTKDQCFQLLCKSCNSKKSNN